MPLRIYNNLSREVAVCGLPMEHIYPHPPFRDAECSVTPNSYFQKVCQSLNKGRIQQLKDCQS